MLTEEQRLQLICEATCYCQRVRDLGMPAAAYTKALREPVHFLWERRSGSKEVSAQRRSRAARGRTIGARELVYDHAVPFRYLQRELLALEVVTPATVRAVLERYGTIVLITAREDAKLNRAGLNRRMPDDWNKTDPLARYKAVGIETVPNTVPARKDCK